MVTQIQPEILSFPFAASLVDAHLDSLIVDEQGQELVLDYREFQPQTTPSIGQREKRLYERIRGQHLPRRLRFRGIERLERSGVYAALDSLPAEDSARKLQGMIYWRAPDGIERFMLYSSPQRPGMLLFTAQAWQAERRDEEPQTVEIERDWSSTPLSPPRIVPQPFALHQQYGGDPIRLNLKGTSYERSLFIGGLSEQDHERPAVDAVLNLSEHASVWITDGRIPAQDRWATKGEGHVGMSLPDIVREAEWVIERLRAGQRVLVHCTAGYNRSATICCATLILLEGLSAEAALDRLREEHPWARPDAYHWLKLQWLAQSQG